MANNDLLRARGALRLARGRIREVSTTCSSSAPVTSSGEARTRLPRGGARAPRSRWPPRGTRRAQRLIPEELERARRWGAASGMGIALRASARRRAGRAQWIAWPRRWKRSSSPARLEQARALTDLGAALRRANRRSEARGRPRKDSISPSAAARTRRPRPHRAERAVVDRATPTARSVSSRPHRSAASPSSRRMGSATGDRADPVRDAKDRRDPSRPRLPQA